MVFSAAALGAIASGLSAVGSLAGGFGGLFGSSNGVSVGDQANLMKYQNTLSQELMATQYDYNRKLRQTSAEDMRIAGLNPILAATNGQTSSVGLPSQGILDPAGASSSQTSAKQLKMQSLMNMANTLSDIMLKRSNSALNSEQAITEFTKRLNIQEDTFLKQLDGVKKEIENSNLPEYYKRQFELVKANTELAIMKKNLIPFEAQTGRIGASANMMNALTGKYLRESQRDLNYSQEWYNRHRSLGYSKHQSWKGFGLGYDYSYTGDE